MAAKRASGPIGLIEKFIREIRRFGPFSAVYSPQPFTIRDEVMIATLHG
jgi:hypothetical protein